MLQNGEVMFCLATYNIWNSKEGMPFRNTCVLEEIRKMNPDIIGLQEVADKCMAEAIAKELNMNCFFSNISGEDEGICLLYRYPMIDSVSWTLDVNAQYACFEIDSKLIGIVNLHLPWDSVIHREDGIVSIITKMKEKKADYVFMLGDFNCGSNSDVIRMLLGNCQIQGIEANPCFYDLAHASAQLKGTCVKDTLNFRENPRFADNTIEVNQRFDRILLQNTYPFEFPHLIECDIFGTKVYSEISLAASDHYGVFAKIEFYA